MRPPNVILAILIVLTPCCSSPPPGALDGPLLPVDGPVDSPAALPDTPVLDVPFTPDAGTPDVSLPAADSGAQPDGAQPDGVQPDSAQPDGATYRTSLGVCWTDPTCRRALIVSHGGDWTLTIPYGSFSAFKQAHANGADGIKCDLRMTKDGVAVAAHSSPLKIWESLDCYGKKIEDMTAAQVTSCHMLPSLETFPRVDDVLAWAKGKLIVMLTVKESSDFAGGIATVLAAGAQDRVFFEIGTGDFQNTLKSVTGGKKVYYLVKIDATSDVDLMLYKGKSPRAFMYELEPTYSNASAAQVAAMIKTKLRPAGIRPFAASAANPITATVQNHLGLFNQGFEVVMSYNLANGVAARIKANKAAGISPRDGCGPRCVQG